MSLRLCVCRIIGTSLTLKTLETYNYSFLPFELTSMARSCKNNPDHNFPGAGWPFLFKGYKGRES